MLPTFNHSKQSFYMAVPLQKFDLQVPKYLTET